MNPRSLRLLELDKVIAMLREKCVTPMGEALAQELYPRTDLDQVLALQEQTREGVDLLSKEEPSLSGLVDISKEISRAGKGGILDAAQLHRVAVFLGGSMALKRFLDKKAPRESWLHLAAQGLVELPSLAAQIN